MNNVIHFSSKDFLVDVKIQIKKQFKNQERFAEAVFITRKQLFRILTHPDNLSVYWVEEFCLKLDLDLRNYIRD